MKRNVQAHQVLAGAALVALALTACSSNPANGDASGELSGDVKIDGSSTVAPLSEAAAELYSDEQPKVKVSVGTSGTGGGFEKFCAGETDISDASRPIKDEEKAACEQAGVEYVELVVANDALSVVVNKANDWAKCLTVQQLKKIWAPDSTVKSWKDVDPKFPSEPLKLYGPGTDSGTFDYFTDEINGEEGASRKDYEASEDDNVLVSGVASTKGALGYFGFTYFEENEDKLRALQIDAGDGCVEPNLETVQSGSYKPLSRPLFIYVSKKALDRPEVKSFVDYYIGQIDGIVKEARYIPLTDQQKQTLKDEFSSV
ncbi:MAG TPA: PstS family phosphate ABC transporter substrate-binding protein [Micromonosporaceae bacterium]|nr:PstS family phosphate ABC transporter substrate-binding protein [Micromonosporaceae bacterium]